MVQTEKIKPQPEKPRSSGVMFTLLVLVAFVVLGYICYRLFNETYKQNQINVEIAHLQSEIDRLNQDNDDLNELISYLQTDEFKEKEAKDKLNLIKEGEQLVLIKEKEALKTMQPEEPVRKEAQILIDRPNYYWWWHYYFSI